VPALEVAERTFERMRGLLGRPGLAPGSGLLIADCGHVHSFFMKFAIDLIWIDDQWRVVKLARRVPPWRFSGAWRASRVVELPAGALDGMGLAVGDRVRVE